MSSIWWKKHLRKIIIIAAGVIGCLLIGVAVYAGVLYYKADRALGNIATEAPSQAETPPQPSNEEQQPEDSEAQEDQLKPMSLLLLGVDQREGSGGTMNTDVIMLVSLNPQNHTATILSLPRDLRLTPETFSPHKANYYYAYYYNKDKDTALSNTKKLFGDMFDFPIDYAAIINFDGLRQMVDALGGLEIDVDMNMKYVDKEDGTDIDLKKGLQTLDGKHALDFIRYRKSNQGTAESSDIARNGRQHQVLSKLLDKLTSLNGISQWGNVLDIVGNNVKTDVSKDQLVEWILSFTKLKPDVIRYVEMESQWKSPYIYLKEDDLRKGLEALRNGMKPAAVTVPGYGAGSDSGTNSVPGTNSDPGTESDPNDRLSEQVGLYH